MGKRLHAGSSSKAMSRRRGYVEAGYLLALEMEMDPVPGYGIASWEQGYGDFGLRPDMDTLRRIPWLEASALVYDVVWLTGQSLPRQVLRRQVERAAELGFEPMVGSGARVPPEGETYEETAEALPGHNAVGHHPRLPHPRAHDLRRAAHPPDP